jgi:hypothetical protein
VALRLLEVAFGPRIEIVNNQPGSRIILHPGEYES